MRELKKIVLSLLFVFSLPILGQKYWSGDKSDIYISVGTNIGGTSPIPVPKTVQNIRKWRAGLNPSFELSTTFWHPLYRNWGLNTGLSLEYKGMQAVALVRNFPLRIGSLDGLYRGENQTRVRNGYISLPVQAAYRSDGRFSFRLGLFLAYSAERSFKGIVRDGFLRIDSQPMPMKIEEEAYDFSEEIRAFDAGLLMSGDMYLRDKLSLKLGFSWGFVPIFKSDFKGVAYNLYNIYLNTGLSYRW